VRLLQDIVLGIMTIDQRRCHRDEVKSMVGRPKPPRSLLLLLPQPRPLLLLLPLLPLPFLLPLML
jgi:hypothetical protein